MKETKTFAVTGTFHGSIVEDENYWRNLIEAQSKAEQ